MTVQLMVIDALVMISKDLEKRLKELEIRGRIETTQFTELLSSRIILRRVLET